MEALSRVVLRRRCESMSRALGASVQRVSIRPRRRRGTAASASSKVFLPVPSLEVVKVQYGDLITISPTIISNNNNELQKHHEFHSSGNICYESSMFSFEFIVGEHVIKSLSESCPGVAGGCRDPAECKASVANG